VNIHQVDQNVDDPARANDSGHVEAFALGVDRELIASAHLPAIVHQREVEFPSYP
jgi:hypothetical protein